jgi:hypothetical protein
MSVYYTYRMPPTCFGHSCGYLQGGALQRTNTSKYYRSFWKNAQIWIYNGVVSHTQLTLVCDCKFHYTFECYRPAGMLHIKHRYKKIRSALQRTNTSKYYRRFWKNAQIWIYNGVVSHTQLTLVYDCKFHYTFECYTPAGMLHIKHRYKKLEVHYKGQIHRNICALVQKLLWCYHATILCNAPPWRWPHEWPKHVGGIRCV